MTFVSPHPLPASPRWPRFPCSACRLRTAACSRRTRSGCRRSPPRPSLPHPSFPSPTPPTSPPPGPAKRLSTDFFRLNWGFDENRVWQVQAIKKTAIEGISKATLLVAEKGVKGDPQSISFLIAVDGKHIVSGEDILRSDDHPYAENRALLQQRADGPYRGSAAKDLEIVEFSDLQCPHCKEAQANMEKLAVDFPKARIVFQNLPLPMHTAAAQAAAFGVCVSKQGGSDAFFNYVSAVFEGQDGLATADGAALTLNSAVTKVGLDPVKIAACAATPEVVANVEASKKLAMDLEINATPTLAVNGRLVPANIPYDSIKKIILFQAKLDGVVAQ